MSEYRTGGITDFLVDVGKAVAQAGVKQLDDKEKDKSKAKQPVNMDAANPAGYPAAKRATSSDAFPMWAWLIVGYLVMKAVR